ncbi:hypothetical protein [Mycobacterium dioxanotrophicus]|uniref:hypothetical protein n=1 Tax=Mycobacterium dioxanotrophicus TaxID=482462 RepID=UPI0012FAA62B|nr:hypothetical protein [Mycobacterium dioxanotrophicus]
MKFLDSLRRSPSPAVVLPPLHMPIRSCDHFTSAPLDPIPLGVDTATDDTLHWDPSGPGDHLLIVNTTGGGGTAAARNVVEQCRTRGWQVIAADGKYDLYGLDSAANISFLGRPGDGFADPAWAQCMAAVVIAHRLFTARSAAARRGERVPNSPVLLVLTEFGGMVQQWHNQLPNHDVRELLDLIDEVRRGGGAVRCHVLMLPGSGHRWQAPRGWGRLCTQMFLGDLCARDAVPYTDTPVLKMGRGQRAGRGALVVPGEDGGRIRAIRGFYTYAPGSKLDGDGRTTGVAEQWEAFKAAVSDTTPALHPRLRLDPIAAGFPDIAACLWSELRRLPLATVPVS